MVISHNHPLITTRLLVFTLTSVFVPGILFGTGQQADLIIFEGDTLELHSLPLEHYLGEYEERVQKYPFLKQSCSTALWRSYQGLWMLNNDELFLIDVFLCADRERSIFHDLINADSPIKAKWFTGKLFIQHGKMIKYYHSGFERYFEEETIIEISEGSKVGQQHFTNGYKPDDANFIDHHDSVMSEVYHRINWENLDDLSTDYRVFVNVKFGAADSLWVIKSFAPEKHVRELMRVLNQFPDIRKFYSRGKPLERTYTFPIVFSKEQRRRIEH